MGSTSHYDDRTTKSMPNVALNMFRQGNYRQARSEFNHFLLDHQNNRQARVMLAICEFRLGERSALASLQRNLGHSLTTEDKDLVMRHEFLQLLVERRFEAAISLLHTTASGVDRISLNRAGDVIDNLRTADRLSTRRIQKIVELDTASDVTRMIRGDCDSSRTPQAQLISIMNDYLSLLIELLHGSSTRERNVERECRQRIAAADSQLGNSLPRSLKVHGFRELFKP